MSYQLFFETNNTEPVDISTEKSISSSSYNSNIPFIGPLMGVSASKPMYDIGTFISLYFYFYNFFFFGGGRETVKGCNEHRGTGLSHVLLLPSYGPFLNY